MNRLVVCFDLGGVLVRICRSWIEACERASVPLRDASWLDSPSWRSAIAPVLDGYQRGHIESDAYYRGIAAASRDALTPREVEMIHQAWTRREYSGAAALVERLNATPNVVTACLSNTNHAHWQRLAGLDGAGEYPAVQMLRAPLASHELGRVKPEPDSYAAAHARFREFVGADTTVLFFDDLEENVAGALRHGWQASQIDPHGDTIEQIRKQLSNLGLDI